jgi:hypothetical protein
MNPRKFLNFLRSRTGMLILFLLAMCAVLIVVNSHRSRTKSELSFSGKVSDVDSGNRRKPQLIESIRREMVPFRPPQSDDKLAKQAPATSKPGAVSPNLPPISIIAETPSNEPKPKEPERKISRRSAGSFLVS